MKLICNQNLIGLRLGLNWSTLPQFIVPLFPKDWTFAKYWIENIKLQIKIYFHLWHKCNFSSTFCWFEYKDRCFFHKKNKIVCFVLQLPVYGTYKARLSLLVRIGLKNKEMDFFYGNCHEGGGGSRVPLRFCQFFFGEYHLETPPDCQNPFCT